VWLGALTQVVPAALCWAALPAAGPRRREVACRAIGMSLKTRLEHGVTDTGSPLMDLPGVGAITAARILCETGDVRRFRDHNAYASANGTAPIPASSGEVTRHRVNRGGNRLLNEAIHTIALVQNRGVGPGKAFIEQRRANGRTTAKPALTETTPLRRRLPRPARRPPTPRSSRHSMIH